MQLRHVTVKDREGQMLTASCCRDVPASCKDREQDGRYHLRCFLRVKSHFSLKGHERWITGKRDRPSGSCFPLWARRTSIQGTLQRTPRDGKEYSGIFCWTLWLLWLDESSLPLRISVFNLLAGGMALFFLVDFYFLTSQSLKLLPSFPSF